VRDAIFSVGARNESRVLSLMSALPVNAGTPASPMRMLSRCSEHPLDVPIDGPHRADARVRRVTRSRRPGGRIGSSGGPRRGLRSCDQLSAFRDVLRAQLAFFSAASIAALSEQIVVLS
jgi:hypothetical protein